VVLYGAASTYAFSRLPNSQKLWYNSNDKHVIGLASYGSPHQDVETFE
jgi:hypothetical protein